MSCRDRSDFGKWAALAAAVILLALCLLLLGRLTATAEEKPALYRPALNSPADGLDLMMDVNYADDWVEGAYEEGHTVWLTSTKSDGSTVRATAELKTKVVPEWGGWTGFATELAEPWVPDRPDIQPGDWVYGQVDNGYTSTVRVGTINGVLDLVADTVAGTIDADWFTEPLTGSCNVWQESGPGSEFPVDPDGGTYSCDFSTMGWDLLPGQQVAVSYREPDGDRVWNVFRSPAPNLQLDKWPEGNEVAPGGPVVFTMRYRNGGDDDAPIVLLTDTLPLGTTYLTDSSGVAANVGAGVVTWTLGPVAPDEEVRFQIVLTNTASASDTLHNEADIYTLYDSDPSNNHAENEIHVAEGQPDLYVSKSPDPGDPVPGQTFLYRIDYGNNGPVASGPVVLTDTIPEHTSIVSWHSQNGYNLWTEVSGGDQLVLQVPTIPGYWGDQILLRLRVDGATPQGTQLTNEVEITTDNDANPGDNWQQRDDWVGSPRWNVWVDKRFSWGRMVSGGLVSYGIDVANGGNMAAQVWLTDTLPEGTTLVKAWLWTGSVDVPFPPDSVDGQIARWDLGVMEPGQHYSLQILLSIDEDTVPDTAIDNCATVAIDGDDVSPSDNSSCVGEVIRGFGPNLRVYKEVWWNGEGQLQYRIYFENIGTQDLKDVWITDTYPDSTSVVNWGPDFHRWITATDHPAQHQIVFWVEEIQVEENGRINLQVDLDGGIIGDQGLGFTNQLEAPIADDVYPNDNSYKLTTYTGPDLYVYKWLSKGEPLPGKRLTLTVRFGNASLHPWRMSDETSARLIERLPEGMTYVKAVWPDGTPNTPFFYNHETGLVLWDVGGLGSDDHRMFYLVVDLDDKLEGNWQLLNRIEIEQWPARDTDPRPENNMFSYLLSNPHYWVDLPIVLKSH
jgi:uncharacterized repeat protein (TIGR01451 family)